MFYREAGDFKTSYAADQSILSIKLDRYFVIGLIAFGVIVVPMIGNDYWLGSLLIPVLVLSIAALGLNILTGYAGQLSLGTGAFMATGAYMAYKVATNLAFLGAPVAIIIGGLSAAFAGVLFGLPSLRIKGFYLAVTTLAAQFFLLWLFTHVDWFVNYSISGVPSIPPMEFFGVLISGAEATTEARYLFVLGFAIILGLAARNLARCKMGRGWMAIRDMDIAAEIIGIDPLKAKLSAFAISSFYCGVAGALWAFCFINTVEPGAYDINRSFQILFMVIIGGLGSILGSFLGAAFIVLLPIFLNNAPQWIGLNLTSDVISHMEIMIFGALIVFFLIVEPHGLARLWQIAKEKLRRWPFPY
ncbi:MULTISPECIES: branched-chain amino acid ABC transporter permease [Curvivirga]|uniref:branched-chain amino acid ABC transporter permease n=1 Tax=Curvivirga TaxID=2856846 RepID=UPI0012BCCDBC|nr:branched-chain amino acid ABC transporter permease [Curvivirga aplysinae]MTI09505.1 branched-chain amino acid ABC transporter permease [Curvivirga aplysinae]